MGNLKINDFAIVIRNIVDVGKTKELKSLEMEKIRGFFQEIRVPESELFEIGNYVFQRVCSLNKNDIVRIELPSIQVIDVPKIFYMHDDKIVEAFEKNEKREVLLYPALHRSGVLMINMHLHFESQEGYGIKEAIELTRFNLKTLAIKIPEPLLGKIELRASPEDALHWRWIKSEKGTFLVGSLKDLSSEFIRPLFIHYLERKLSLQPLRDRRCISSTLIQVYKTDPPCESIEKFLEISNYGKEMRGLGSLDRSYESRTEAMVQESFANDLSVDEEVGVFTFGLSDLMLFSTTFEKTVDEMMAEKKYKDRYAAVIYNSTHYSCLLEWVYLEKYIIDLYSRLLSRAISAEDATPETMLGLQQQTMHDLIAYTSGITPYPSREEFLEKGRVAHHIPEMQEKLEKKRDLATDYVIQEYTLKTNKSIQLVNIFISATAAFGLMEVILNISQRQPGERSYWAAATVLLFGATIVLLWGMNKIFMAMRGKK